MADLERLIGLIDTTLAEADRKVGEPVEYADYWGWQRARNLAMETATDELRRAGAEIRLGTGDAMVRLAGIRSTSTSGVHGALRNWQAAARKRLESGAAR